MATAVIHASPLIQNYLGPQRGSRGSRRDKGGAGSGGGLFKTNQCWLIGALMLDHSTITEVAVSRQVA